jgi:hypothetical protein
VKPARSSIAGRKVDISDGGMAGGLICTHKERGRISP